MPIYLIDGERWGRTQKEAKDSKLPFLTRETPRSAADFLEFLNEATALGIAKGRQLERAASVPVAGEAAPSRPSPTMTIGGKPSAPAPDDSSYRSPLSAHTTIQRIDAGMIGEAIRGMDDGKSLGNLLAIMIDRLSAILRRTDAALVGTTEDDHGT
jgi:hypothetical protein